MLLSAGMEETQGGMDVQGSCRDAGGLGKGSNSGEGLAEDGGALGAPRRGSSRDEACRCDMHSALGIGHTVRILYTVTE